MARRRRGSGGTWFPNLGTAGPEGDEDDDDAGIFINAILSTAIPSQSVITDLTFDNPIEDEALSATASRSSLSDIIGSEYILKRIVGKVLAAVDQSNSAFVGQFGVLLTCGFFVARAEDSTTESAVNPQPIGTETEVEKRENYSPAVPSTIREPWIWRRRWILGNQARQSTGSAPTSLASSATAAFPSSTAGYGSVMDGPHIDAHTVRRVSQDDRLWFAAAFRLLSADWGAQPFGPGQLGVNPIGINIHLDYRLFGRLIKAKQHGAF